MVKYIQFIRHGQYFIEKENEKFGQLTELGMAQCKKAGLRLKNEKFDLVLASPLERAQQSAQIICKELGCDFTTKKFLKEGVPSVKNPPPENLKNISEEKVQTDRILMNTAVDFFANHLKAEQTLVIAHGNLIRYICQQLLGLPQNTWFSLDLYNGSLTRVRKKDGNFHLIQMSDVGHLTKKEQTFI